MSLFDSALLRRRDELGDLLDFYRPYLLRLARAWNDSDLRPRFSESDAVQQAMLAASISFDRCGGTTEHEFRKWLATILRNQLIDARRMYKQAIKRDLDREQRLDLDRVISDGGDVAELVETQESIERLLNAIERLPEVSRAIVRERYLQDLSFEEIAAHRDVSREWVRRRWKEALHTLGTQLRISDG